MISAQITSKLKAFSVHTLTLFLGLGLLSSALSKRDAAAAKMDTVPAIKLEKLGNLVGQEVTVMYVLGTKPFIATGASQININQVKKYSRFTLTNDTLLIPSVDIEKEGIRPSYNMVVIVVSPIPNYSWINADGTTPVGLPASGNHLNSFIKIMDRSEVESLQRSGESISFVASRENSLDFEY